MTAADTDAQAREIAADEHFTTNLHEPRERGVPGGRRVKLTATGDGELVWCELYDADGSLRGCGPSLLGLSGRLLDMAQERLSFEPALHPLYWRAVARVLASQEVDRG